MKQCKKKEKTKLPKYGIIMAILRILSTVFGACALVVVLCMGGFILSLKVGIILEGIAIGCMVIFRVGYGIFSALSLKNKVVSKHKKSAEKIEQKNVNPENEIFDI